MFMEFERQFDPESNPNFQGNEQRLVADQIGSSTEQHLQLAPDLPQNLSEETSCVHHWEIPTGEAIVIGCCKNCGAEREFNNTTVEVGFNGRLFGKTKPKRENEWLDDVVKNREPNDFDYDPDAVFRRFEPEDESY